jgi:orotidine-5'-phosphate decarboxylase
MNPIYLAIDTPDADAAQQILDEVRDLIGGIKIGLTFLYANPTRVRDLVAGMDWFLDAKIHDIPMQAAGAVRSLMPLQPTYLSVHIGEMQPNASEDDRWHEDLMLRSVISAATEESFKLGVPYPKLLGVTTLTHLPATATAIVAKAHRGMMCGLDGIISSPLELRALRSELGSKPILLTPGIRTGQVSDRDDQLRTATPKYAMESGANIIVVGRAITQAGDRRKVAEEILGSLS